MRTAVASLILILAVVPQAVAVDPLAAGIAPLIEEGNAARARAEWDAADDAYRRALDLATRQGDKQWQYRAWFYIGLVKHMAGEAVADEAAKRTLFEQTREPYRTAIALNPESKSARINLSEVEWALGNREGAVALLTEALALDEAADIAEKLGDAQRELGHRDEAARAYTLAATKNPDSVTLHDKLLAVLLDGEASLGPATAAYLDALVDRKQIDRALDAATRALAQPALSAEDGRAVRTMIAAALALKDYDAAAFKSSAAAEKLNALIAAGSPHAPALQALVDAYEGTIESKSSFEVWADSRPIGPPSAGYPLPVTAFRSVLRSIASTLSRQLKHDRAIAYYRLALAMDEAHVDAASVRALASIYASRGNYAKLSELADRYQQAMSERATGTADAEDVYEYFRLLGRMHTERTPATAEGLHPFEMAKTAGAGGIAEPQLYEHLSELYEKRGETDKSNREKFSAATAYMQRGNLQFARAAIADLGYAVPDGVDHEAYKKMVHELVWLPDSVREVIPANEHFTIKRNLVLLCAGGAREGRVKADAELKKLGITVDIQENMLHVQRNGRAIDSRFVLPVKPSP